jgi:hypothetical protein
MLSILRSIMTRLPLSFSVALALLLLLSSSASWADSLPTVNDASSEAKAAVQHLVKFDDAASGISFSYPQNWSTTGVKSKSDLVAFSLWKGMVNGRVAAVNVGNSVTLEKIAITPREVPVLGQRCPVTIVSQSRIEVGKVPAIQIVYTYQLPKPLSYPRKVMQVYVLNKDKDYIINFGCPLAFYDAFGDLRQQILKSVQFTP